MGHRFSWFSFETPRQRQRSMEKYERASFPHGAAQKTAVEGLLRQLVPEEKLPLALTCYLSGRDVYRDRYGQSEFERPEERLEEVKEELLTVLHPALKWHWPLYLALIEADAAVSEELNYPSPETLRARAEELKAML